MCLLFFPRIDALPGVCVVCVCVLVSGSVCTSVCLTMCATAEICLRDALFSPFTESSKQTCLSVSRELIAFSH